MNEHKRRTRWIVVVMMAGCFAHAFAQDVVPVAPDSDVAQTSVVSEAVSMPVITPGSEVMAEPLGEPLVSPVEEEPSAISSETPAVETAPAAVEAIQPSEIEVTEAAAPAGTGEEVPATTTMMPEPETVIPAPETAVPDLETAMPEPETAVPAPETAMPAPEMVSPAETEVMATEAATPAEPPVGEAQVAPETEAVSVQEVTAAPLTEPQVMTTPLSEPEVAAVPVTEPEAAMQPEVASMAETSTVGALVSPIPAEGAPEAMAVEPALETNVTTELIELQAEGGEGGSDVVESGAKENLISISLDNVPLQDVMRMFARISGANIVSGTNLQGNITVNLKDV